MAPRSGFRHPRTGAGSRRRTSWALGPGATTATQITVGGAAIIGLGAEAINEGMTIVRLRGQLQILGQVFTTLGDGFHGAFGLCIVSQNAFGVGITAIPAPITDVGWNGWFYHRFIDVHRGTTDIADGSGFQRIDVDSKAMRKIKLTDTIVAVLEVTEAGTADVDVYFDSRILVKLP